MSVPPDTGPVPAARPDSTLRVVYRLMPISAVLFVGMLTMAVPLPVLPLHVNGTLAMSALVVGVVVGIHFAAALLTRAWAGGLADTKGSRRAVLVGLDIAALAGLVHLISLAFLAEPDISVGVLLLGRVLLGCGESFIVTGTLSWGVGLVGPQNAGKVMAWTGIAIYSAYAAGAPAGVAIYGEYGFLGVAIAILAIPIVAAGVVMGVRPIAPPSVRRAPFYKVLGVVWLPGVGMALSTAGFAAIAAFIALLFAAEDWGNASLAFTAFGSAFVGARLFFSHLPDKLGGAKVACVALLIESAGQLLIWDAATPFAAYVGAAFTGFGYSLAFPSFGVEAVKRAPAQSRGVAMGAYVAFFDLSMGVTGPAAGVIATVSGVSSVYLAGAIAVFCGLAAALLLLVDRPKAA